MPGLISNTGERQLLIRALGGGCSIKLFTNDREPQKKDTIESYTEASGHGYSSKLLFEKDWTVLSGTDYVVASYEEQEWVFTGSLGEVYGYYVTNSEGTELLWAERFGNGPYDIRNEGDRLRIVPSIRTRGR